MSEIWADRLTTGIAPRISMVLNRARDIVGLDILGAPKTHVEIHPVGRKRVPEIDPIAVRA